MKIGIIILMFVVFSASVSATTFTENVTFSQDNIDYVFIKGLEIDSFEVLPTGLKINDAKFGITIQGGKLTIRFYTFNKFDKEISFQSNVRQLIQFKITDDGVKQYLYDQKSYHLTDYNIGTEEQFFSLVEFQEDTPIKTIGDVKKVEKLKWYQQKMFEIEKSTSLNSQGIIKGEAFSITYLWFTIIVVGLLALMMIWWVFK